MTEPYDQANDEIPPPAFTHPDGFVDVTEAPEDVEALEMLRYFRLFLDAPSKVTAFTLDATPLILVKLTDEEVQRSSEAVAEAERQEALDRKWLAEVVFLLEGESMDDEVVWLRDFARRAGLSDEVSPGSGSTSVVRND